MSNVQYNRWANYLKRLFGEDADLKILELASGTCKMGMVLKNYYKNIIFSDLSYPMLKTCSGKNLNRVCCDMTKLPFKTKFDIIFSTFDSINYLTSKKKLYGCFKEIKFHLNEDGRFFFDVSLENNSFKHVKTNNTSGFINGIEFNQKSIFNRKTKIHSNIFTFNYDGNVVKEIHKQKIYPFNTYFELLSKAGLYVQQCYDFFTFKDGDENSDRIQFIVKKQS